MGWGESEIERLSLRCKKRRDKGKEGEMEERSLVNPID